MQRRYLPCAATAKLVRAALKQHFPGVRFGVRSHTYAGGASINVEWTDGPTVKAVEGVAKQYEGSNFDGMIDLKHHRQHWLLPNGRVVVQSDPGTEGSRGAHPAVKGPGTEFAEITGAVLVSLGADYVFCHREVSPAALEAAIVEVRRIGEKERPEWGDESSDWFLPIGGRCIRARGLTHAGRVMAEHLANPAPGEND